MERNSFSVTNKNIWLLLFFIVLSFASPWLLLHNSHFSKYFDFSTSVSNNIAATIGGILSPLFSLFGSYLVYSALKEQQKSNKIANSALKTSRAQADSAQIAQQIDVLETSKESTINNINQLDFYTVEKLDSLLKYYEEKATTINRSVFDGILFQILRYINEYEITFDLISKLEINQEMYYKKLYFTHEALNTAFVNTLVNVDFAHESILKKTKEDQSAEEQKKMEAILSKLKNIHKALAAAVHSYESMNLKAKIIG